MPYACYTLSYIRAGYISSRKFSHSFYIYEGPFLFLYAGLSFLCLCEVDVWRSFHCPFICMSFHLQQWGGIRHVTFANPSKWLDVCVCVHRRHSFFVCRGLSSILYCLSSCLPFVSLLFLLNSEKSLLILLPAYKSVIPSTCNVVCSFYLYKGLFECRCHLFYLKNVCHFFTCILFLLPTSTV